MLNLHFIPVGGFVGSIAPQSPLHSAAPLMRSPMLRIGALRYAPDIVRSQPRTASLLSGNSVLRAVFGSGRPTRRCWLLCFNDSASGGREASPPRSSPAARAKRTAADNKPASTCSGLQICVNLQSCLVRPSMAFSFPVSD